MRTRENFRRGANSSSRLARRRRPRRECASEFVTHEGEEKPFAPRHAVAPEFCAEILRLLSSGFRGLSLIQSRPRRLRRICICHVELYLKIRCVDFRRHCRIHRFCRRCASFRRSRIQALAEILRLLSSGFRGLSLDILARGSPPLAKRHRLRVFRQTLRCALRQRAMAPFLARAPHPSVERARKGKPLRTRENFRRGANSSSRLARRRRPRRERASEFVTHEGEEKPFAPRHAVAPEFCAEILRLLSSGFRGLSLIQSRPRRLRRICICHVELYLKIRCVDFRRHCRIHRFCRRCASFRRSRIQALAEILRLLSSGCGEPRYRARFAANAFAFFVRRSVARCANARWRRFSLARHTHPSNARERAKPLRTRENFRRGANSSRFATRASS